MGLLISRFKRKKETTFQVLEGLDSRIKRAEAKVRDTEERERYVIGRFVLYSSALYLIAALTVYFLYFPTTRKGQAIAITPLLLFPLVIFGLRRVLKWNYGRQSRSTQSELSRLREEKRKTLETVKDTETYKVAQKILEQFAPDQLRRAPLAPPISTVSVRPALPSTPRQGAGPVAMLTPGPRPVAPPPGTPGFADELRRRTITPQTPQQAQLQTLPQTPRLVRPLLPPDRGLVDRLVDFLVGDGPANRFALVCARCHAHNGMALKEEFEYLAYRCCFCGFSNPARKQRPPAPRLPLALGASAPMTPSESSQEESEEEGGLSGPEESPEELAAPATESATPTSTKDTTGGDTPPEGAEPTEPAKEEAKA